MYENMPIGSSTIFTTGTCTVSRWPSMKVTLSKSPAAMPSARASTRVRTMPSGGSATACSVSSSTQRV